MFQPTRIYSVEPFSEGRRVIHWAVPSWDDAVEKAHELAQDTRYDYVHACESDAEEHLLRVQSFPEGLLLSFPLPDEGEGPLVGPWPAGPSDP